MCTSKQCKLTTSTLRYYRLYSFVLLSATSRHTVVTANLMKQMCRIYQIALVFHVFGWSAQANDLFLSDTLVRKGQLQDVLEHQPAKVPSCKNAVVRSFEVASTAC